MIGQNEAKEIVARCVAAVNANKTCGIGDVLSLLNLYSEAKTETDYWKKERDLYFDELEKAVAERDVMAECLGQHIGSKTVQELKDAALDVVARRKDAANAS